MEVTFYWWRQSLFTFLCFAWDCLQLLSHSDMMLCRQLSEEVDSVKACKILLFCCCCCCCYCFFCAYRDLEGVRLFTAFTLSCLILEDSFVHCHCDFFNVVHFCLFLEKCFAVHFSLVLQAK